MNEKDAEAIIRETAGFDFDEDEALEDYCDCCDNDMEDCDCDNSCVDGMHHAYESVIPEG